MNAIDQREQRIAPTRSDAAASKAQAVTDRDALRAKNDAFETERADLLSKATEAASEERKRLIDAARKDADALAEKQQKALASDAESLSGEIGRRAETEIFAITRKVLADIADARIEERMSALFLVKLDALQLPAKAAVAKMLARASPRGCKAERRSEL